MEPIEKAPLYRVWGTDKVAYGPMELPALVQWIQSGRVTPDSWLLFEASNQWQRAADLPELKAVFGFQPGTLSPASGQAAPARRASQVNPASLRHIKLFANMTDAQLESFVLYLETVRFPQYSHIFRQGDHGDSMYLVFEGEVRALAIVEGKESTLGPISVGEWFGEISLLDQGPRSVDIIADQDSVLLKLSSAAFERMLREAPALAMPLVLALGRTVVERLRRATKRYVDSVRFIRTSGTPR